MKSSLCLIDVETYIQDSRYFAEQFFFWSMGWAHCYDKVSIRDLTCVCVCLKGGIRASGSYLHLPSYFFFLADGSDGSNKGEHWCSPLPPGQVWCIGLRIWTGFGWRRMALCCLTLRSCDFGKMDGKSLVCIPHTAALILFPFMFNAEMERFVIDVCICADVEKKLENGALTTLQLTGLPFMSVAGGARGSQVRPLLKVMRVVTFPSTFWLARKTPFTPRT